jgi:hypothetical protein
VHNFTSGEGKLALKYVHNSKEGVHNTSESYAQGGGTLIKLFQAWRGVPMPNETKAPPRKPAERSAEQH